MPGKSFISLRKNFSSNRNCGDRFVEIQLTFNFHIIESYKLSNTGINFRTFNSEKTLKKILNRDGSFVEWINVTFSASQVQHCHISQFLNVPKWINFSSLIFTDFCFFEQDIKKKIKFYLIP